MRQSGMVMIQFHGENSLYVIFHISPILPHCKSKLISNAIRTKWTHREKLSISHKQNDYTRMFLSTYNPNNYFTIDAFFRFPFAFTQSWPPSPPYLAREPMISPSERVAPCPWLCFTITIKKKSRLIIPKLFSL